MIEKFFKLDKEKQDRIINAAIKEFAQKGYENASTNEVVKAAEISKGALFHYFKNKKQLFLFLFDYCVEIITEEFYKKINLKEPDFFQRMHQIMQIKMELQTSFPAIFKFAEIAYLEDSSEVKMELTQRIKDLTGINTARIYEGIDVTRFRADLDLQKVLKIITWTFDQFGEEELRKARLSPGHVIDYEKVFSEAEAYFAIFKKSFYK